MCHMSYVTCHMSHVMCHMSIFFGEAYRLRVCYQRGLPRLVYMILQGIALCNSFLQQQLSVPLLQEKINL